MLGESSFTCCRGGKFHGKELIFEQALRRVHSQEAFRYGRGGMGAVQ